MKYLFILGRNPKLSLEEVKAFFSCEENKIIDYFLKENGLLVELENPIRQIIEKLGGVISIGEVLVCGKDLVKEIDKQELYFGKQNKFNYLVWNFSEQTADVENYLKKRFRKEKLKSTQKKFGSEMVLQSGKKVPMISSGRRIDEEYFIFDNYFGRIVQKSNYEEIEERDMNKPVRRESLSISPRISKIMINLSKVKPGEKMLDAFSGIGGILQEALLKQIKVIGVEQDKKAVEGARQNLNFGKFDKNNYELINFDSKKVEIPQVSAMVSEPNLGDILKKMPTKENAKNTLRNFEKLMIQVINNLKPKISGRIVFTAPCILQNKKRMSCDLNRILEKTSYSLVKGFPIEEFRENQIVGREIIVLEKNP